jgi:catechol 2,3-dioxygenase-like lactoylglutathione lyase family enzyme
MASSLISGLRSVAINVPDLVAAEKFYTDVWRLNVVARRDAIYLGGSGSDAYLLSLHQGAAMPELRKVTLRARNEVSLHVIAAAAERSGGKVLKKLAANRELGGGQSITIADLDGRIFEVVYGDAFEPKGEAPKIEISKDTPIRLAHAVLNAHDATAAQAFLEAVFGFQLIDKTGIMAFMNCNSDHHSLAFGITDNDALNHIAFVMPDVDAVMRGGGRMKDAGHAIEWGPGRHGPGNNTFNYFIDPFGVVIEYTADVEQVDDTYKVGMPTDWKWPVGRVDQWGISTPPSAKLKEAQKLVKFIDPVLLD